MELEVYLLKGFVSVFAGGYFQLGGAQGLAAVVDGTAGIQAAVLIKQVDAAHAFGDAGQGALDLGLAASGLYGAEVYYVSAAGEGHAQGLACQLRGAVYFYRYAVVAARGYCKG